MTKVLMVKPTYFDIEYSINPHMLNENGELHKIDKALAMSQWNNVKEAFEKAGTDVLVMEGVQGLPDMVFSANHAVVIKDIIVMGNYYSEFRKKETEHFEAFYNSKQLEVLNNDFLEGMLFEGTGDAIWNADQSVLFGGHGFRSHEKAYDLITRKFGIDIITLKLISEDYYHLDTCFAVLNEETVALIESAFDKESLSKIQKHFKNIIKIDPIEGKKGFAGNAFCPDRKHIIVQSGNSKFVSETQKLGFTCLEVDTSEFIKSGGSVFCMKHVLKY